MSCEHHPEKRESTLEARDSCLMTCPIAVKNVVQRDVESRGLQFFVYLVNIYIYHYCIYIYICIYIYGGFQSHDMGVPPVIIHLMFGFSMKQTLDTVPRWSRRIR